MFISFFNLRLIFSRVFRPLWASTFYEGHPDLHPTGQPEARRAAEGQHVRAFFFGSFLFTRKEMNSHMKCEKLSKNFIRRLKKKQISAQQGRNNQKS